MVIARRLPLLARALLCAAALVCGIGMVGPFQGVETAFVPWDKAAHFIAFWGLTSLLYLSFPRRRRFDLTLLALLLGVGIEIAQQLTGRDAELGDVAADAAGAFAVWAPVYFEQLRGLSRGAPRRERRRRGLAGASSPSAPTASESLVPR